MNEESLHRWEAIRAKVTHEDSWIQERVNWLLVSNAFLFAAYAALLTLDQSYSESVLTLPACILMLVPLLGIFLAVFVYIGLEGAKESIIAAEGEATNLLGKDYEKKLKLPSIASTGKALCLGRMASRGISLSIFAA